jgi:hypothetical protein
MLILILLLIVLFMISWSLSYPQREFSVQDLEHGDVIRARRWPLVQIYHYALVIRTMNGLRFLHLPQGSYPADNSVSEFFLQRIPDVVWKRQTVASSFEIYSRFNELRDRRFSLLRFNCADFVNQLIQTNKFK